jgi:hypothetical protein
MELEINSKANLGKRTRHFDMKFFYFTDLIKREKINVEYCPTDEMMANYMTKLLFKPSF